jgi:hypothetical protein
MQYFKSQAKWNAQGYEEIVVPWFEHPDISRIVKSRVVVPLTFLPDGGAYSEFEITEIPS